MVEHDRFVFLRHTHKLQRRPYPAVIPEGVSARVGDENVVSYRIVHPRCPVSAG